MERRKGRASDGDGDRTEEEYVFDGEVATQLGGSEGAALLLAATRVRRERGGGGRGGGGRVVQLYYCKLRGWIGANNDGARGGEEQQKRTTAIEDSRNE